MTSRALIAGATGLIGSNVANHLVSKGWEVYGVARKPQTGIPGVRPVAANLLEPESLRSALAGIDPTHVFFTTCVRRPSAAGPLVPATEKTPDPFDFPTAKTVNPFLRPGRGSRSARHGAILASDGIRARRIADGGLDHRATLEGQPEAAAAFG